MNYNELALELDTITQTLNKQNLASFFELAATASNTKSPELCVAYFAFLISKLLPEHQTEERRIDFFRRAIQVLALEADSELNIAVETCACCGQEFITLAGGRPKQYCSRSCCLEARKWT